MATVKTVIEKAYTKVNGEYEAMTESSDDFKTYLNVLNQVMETWARTPYVKWQSLFNINYELPDPVAAGDLIYPIAEADEIRVANSPFDNVFIMDDDVIVKKYKLTDQALFQALNSGDVCAFMNGNLYFKNIPDEIVGYAIRLPAYVMPPLYTSGSQEVNVDSVSWLVTAIAAFICDASPVPFIARNADKFAKEATVMMKTMKDDNRHRQHLIIKRVNQVSGNSRFSSLSEAIDAGVGVGGINGLDGGTF